MHNPDNLSIQNLRQIIKHLKIPRDDNPHTSSLLQIKIIDNNNCIHPNHHLHHISGSLSSIFEGASICH